VWFSKQGSFWFSPTYLFCTPYLNEVFMSISAEIVPYVGLRISGDGLRFSGLIEFGMTAEEIKEHFLSEPIYITNYGGASDSLMFRVEGIELDFDLDGKLENINCAERTGAFINYSRAEDDSCPEQVYFFAQTLRETLDLYKREVDAKSIEYQDGFISMQSGIMVQLDGWRDGRRKEPAGMVSLFSKSHANSYDFSVPYAKEAKQQANARAEERTVSQTAAKQESAKQSEASKQELIAKMDAYYAKRFGDPTATKVADQQRDAKQQDVRQQEAKQQANARAGERTVSQTAAKQESAKQSEASKQELIAKMDAYYAKRFGEPTAAKVAEQAGGAKSADPQDSKAVGQDYYEQRLGPSDPKWVAQRPEQLAQQQARNERQQAVTEQTQTQSNTQQNNTQQQQQQR
jgi:hypothetical protein